MAVTQFEATDARRAFPCWDEPDKKATFSVSLQVRSGLTALSNMDVVPGDGDGAGGTADRPPSPLAAVDGWKIVRFGKSPLMSTYLVAFVVGEVEHIETATDTGAIPVRVYAPVGYVHRQGHFALDVAKRTLDFFAEYFGQPYPLPKMDMIAIPDFGSGAMENWGLVTYRMTLLLFDPDASTLKTKQQVAYVVGHELAHQWFGNLVTMSWWSDLWLNEGFATWVGWLAADHLFPEWQIWTEFVASDLQAGLSLDALRSSHPIEVSVRDPSDISQIFDSISYSKGASVIRMLEAHLGRDTFKKGLRTYLARHAFGNACTGDLWAALSEASGKPVDVMMAGWTRETGYPILSVAEEAGPDASLSSVSVTQHRFLTSGDAKPDEDKTLWHVPLNVVVAPFRGDGPALQPPPGLQGLVLSDRQASFSMETSSAARSVLYKLNGGQCGFYRVSYPPDRMAALGTAVAAGQLSPQDRLGILNDAFCLGLAGVAPTVRALDLLRHYSSESDTVIWTEISAQLGRLRSMLFESDEATRLALGTLSRRLFGPVASRLGWTFSRDDPDKVALLRTLAISVSGDSGDKGVLAEAKKRFGAFVAALEGGDEKAKIDTLHPNIRGAVFSMVVRYGGDTEYDAVLEIYRNSTVADQKVTALAALGSARLARLVDRTLGLALSDEVKTQDVIYIYRSMAANEDARRPTWQFVQAHWKTLYDRLYLGSLSLLSTIVSASTSHLATDQDAIDVETFFASKGDAVKAISRTVAQSVEKIKNASKWLQRERDDVSAWLRGNT